MKLGALLAVLLALNAFPVCAEDAPTQPNGMTADNPKMTRSGKPMPEFPKSLMFTEPETDSLMAFLDVMKKVKVGVIGSAIEAPPPAEPMPNIYLSALVYHGDKDWSAWINGLLFRPGTAQNGIRPIQVTSHWVLLDVDTEQGPSIRVRLTPNQTYLVKDDKVVDGIFP